MPAPNERARLEERANADFAIVIDFVPDSPDPARVFRSLTQLINTFEKLDRELVRSIDVNIEPVMLLEDVEAGSLKSWMRSALSSVDDTGLKDLDWKKIVGSYLVKAKYLVIDSLHDETEITKEQISGLQRQLLQAAKSTGVKRIPAYIAPSRAILAQSIADITTSLVAFQDGDKAVFVTRDGDQVEFNLSIRITPKTLDELMVEESLSNDETLILKVKKPDFLGDSQWEFIHEHAFEAKVLDYEWLRRFRDNEVPLQPGSAIRALVHVEVGYGAEREVVSKKYQILKVYEVLSPPPREQSNLLNA
jgi:hypothetical protein